MKIRIREGNDFDVVWAIKRAGQPEDLSSATNMKLTLVVYGLVIEHSLFTVTDNLLSINIPKEVTTVNGDYRLIFEYTLPDAGQPDGDLKCKTDVVPFRIVPFTADADDVYTINVTSDIAFGFKGDKGDDGADAYQIWLDLGNEGTYEDFIAYLRQPAVDAGASITELEGEIQVSEGLRVQAESERDSAEETRIQSESERLAAETIRQSNEGNRIDNEATRGQNEAERISEENVRQSNETDRIEAEGVRVQAESERQNTIQEAVAATNLANEKAGLAVTATQNANDKITEIDEVVIPNAELATQNAIDVKNDYETVVKPDMIAKANYAQEQGDYAKQEALAVADIVTETKGNALIIEEVTAQAIVALQNRIIALEKLITDGLLGNIEIMNLDIVENFNIWGKSNLILTGNAPPNVIPDFVGQTFIDTTNKVAYTATGNNSVNDWK